MMKNSENGYHNLATDHSNPNRQTLGNMLHNNSDDQEEYSSFRFSTTSESSATNPPPLSAATSPVAWDQSPSFSSTPSTDLSASPLSKSPWSSHVASESYSYTGLIGSLVRQEGHVYSLAASGDLLYTGSDSKNIRVWKNQKEYSGFKSTSGLVKAIIISGDQIFTGHQDGQIRVWKVSAKDPSMYKRVGKLPTFKAIVKSSFKRSNYVEIRRHKNAIWIKHVDAISCLSLSEDKSLLYSASWDKTIKVWRISDSKCLESINAHDDAVNSIVSGFDGLVFTGSADGSVKVWRREMQGKGTTKHSFSQTLLKQESAVTSLVVSADPSARVIYCGSSDGLVNFWVRDKVFSHGGVLRGHKLAVLCLVASGNLVFSGSADMNICVWRKEGLDHICLSVLSGHTGPVKCLAVEEEKDGAYSYGGERRYMVYSGSLDKSVKIWRVSELAACAMQTPLGPPPQQQHQNVNQTAAWNQVQGFHPSENSGRVTQRRNF